jgi:hypothetical protein
VARLEKANIKAIGFFMTGSPGCCATTVAANLRESLCIDNARLDRR